MNEQTIPGLKLKTAMINSIADGLSDVIMDIDERTNDFDKKGYDFDRYFNFLSACLIQISDLSQDLQTALDSLEETKNPSDRDQTTLGQ
ncbi:hypothetical protein O0Z71_05290 [Ligilactobacillus saerimneri]|uniref:hypothetical protein n=1 Tax=Ligilactobacillus saerimneri TaxID=228229 RepID=UPI0022A7699C|nr:hypothetical protein [Ligilactobacillus saerimneri]MCZ0891853.1 hypothetical protein [Ligilactobacillus saerimneri]